MFRNEVWYKMGRRRCVPSTAHGVVMEVTFWLVFIASTTTCVPVQTIDEILQSVGSDSSLFSGDLESMYGLTHKVWSPHVENEVPADLDHASRSPRLYLALDDQESIEETNTSATPRSRNKREVDPWSLIWYVASFGGFVAFFAVISCTKWCCCCCCSKSESRIPPDASTRPAEPPSEVTQWIDASPPPPYHLFAPPSYDTLFYGSVSEEKNKCDVYVVPIHSHMATLYSTDSSSVPTEPTCS